MTDTDAPTPAPTVRWSRPEAERTEHLLVLLHGYGANEDDLFGLVPQLPDHLTVAAVRAPLTLQPGAYAWFPLTQDPATGELGAEPAPVREAIEGLHAWIAAVRGGFRTVSLLGFSQGMAMATSLLRLDPEAYTCTVGLSGFVVDPDRQEGLGDLFSRDEEVARVRPKVFWGRGQDDPIISEARVEAAHAWLNEHVDLMKVVYAGLPHAINAQELGHVGEYLQHTVPRG
ncbi:phospholipase [Micrococcus sp.]|uniref:alpha/beta hydrolase n=1 Tax=Micrococcus sp. TaxID=1271 RepID=UPI002A91D998|nr:phospholipase [Micrococcus sp.]MDY6054725.1 phospholipase [Micrococcus sp.]